MTGVQTCALPICYDELIEELECNIHLDIMKLSNKKSEIIQLACDSTTQVKLSNLNIDNLINELRTKITTNNIVNNANALFNENTTTSVDDTVSASEIDDRLNTI